MNDTTTGINRNLKLHLATLLLGALALVAPAMADAQAASPATGKDPHAELSCAMCHRGASARAASFAAAGEPDPRSRTCRECHRDLARRAGGTAAALGFHRDKAADCAACHLFHERGRLKTAVGDLRTGQAGLARAVPGHCAACHADGAALGNLSPAHRAAAALYHRDAAQLADVSPSQGCLNCHAAGSGSNWQQQAGGQTLTFNLHATHPLGVAVVAGSGRDERSIRPDLDPRLRLFDGRIECQTCHSLTTTTTDLLVDFAQPHDLCLGCHQLRNARPGPRPEALMATMMAVE